jgi:hypothetical protein
MRFDPFLKTSTKHTSQLIALVLFLLAGLALRAQGDMRFFGTATKAAQPLAGANVVVLMDGKQIISLTTGRNGKFKFTIDLGHQYRINFSAPGCVDMHMLMDLRVPKEKAGLYPDYVAEIPFFSAGDAKVKTDLFASKPFIKVVFDGGKGFHDDPAYRFVDEVFKNPEEERRKQLAIKEAEEKAKRDAEEKSRLEEQERLRLAREEDDRKKREEEERLRNGNKPATNPTNEKSDEPSMESDEIRLEREKQQRLEQEKQNKNVKSQYENNLLKLVAESERQTNLQKYNKMKSASESNSVVETMRRDAETKAQNDTLNQQQKAKAQQTATNKQTKDQQVKVLVETAATEERKDKAGQLKTVATTNGGPLNYEPSPNIVITFLDETFSDTKTTVISWPGGKKIVYKMEVYWWGSTYYYRDDVEIDETTYNAELAKYKK